MQDIIVNARNAKKCLERCPRCKKVFGMTSVLPIQEGSVGIKFYLIHLWCANIQELEELYGKKEEVLRD